MLKNNIRTKLILLLPLLCLCYGCTIITIRENVHYSTAPTNLPNTDRNMKVAGYWVGKHAEPDKLIMSEKEIYKYNDYICNSQKLTVNIENYSVNNSTRAVKKRLQNALKSIATRKLISKDGNIADSDYYKDVVRNMNMEVLDDGVLIDYGVINNFANQRLLPTNEPLFAKENDIDFDILQNSSLEIGTPVVVLHDSLDGKWYYVDGPASDGWVECEKVAITDQEAISKYIHKEPFIVVTTPKGQIFEDPDMTKYYDYVTMGTRLPSASSETAKAIGVQVPFWDENGAAAYKTAYMRRDEVNKGYLPYTPRTILEQSFKMMNVPYGWGGSYGEQDCSRFIQQVFGTIGLQLPRNSKSQSISGNKLLNGGKKTPDEDKKEVLKNSTAGITLLYLPGHIMLYVGSIDNNPYVIHEIWAYREKIKGKDVVKTTSRVVVSDLSLGEGTTKGSLLSRIRIISELQKNPSDK